MTAEAPKTSTLAKRGARDQAAEEGGAKPAKKVKVEAGSSGVEDDVRLQYEKGALSKVNTSQHPTIKALLTKPTMQLTLPILKEFLISHGRSTAGKKADLVERIEEFFEQK